MNHDYQQLRYKKKGYKTHIIFALVVIAVLVVSCPRVFTTNYTRNAHQGHVWEDNPVIAPANFDVYKSSAEIQDELDNLCREEGPYYRVDESIKDEQLRAFSDTFPSIAERYDIPRQVGTNIRNILAEYYDNGIVTDDDYRQMSKQRVRAVNVYNEAKEARKRDFSDMMSVKNVYEDIRANHSDLRTYIQRLKLNQFITPNLTYDKAKTESAVHDARTRIDSISGHVTAGQIIVDKNQIVSSDVYNKLESLETYLNGDKHKKTDDWLQFFGQAIFISLFVISLVIFLVQFRSDYLYGNNHALLISLLCIIFPVVTYQLVKHQMLQVYILPYCILPIYVRVFMDSRTAFITHIVCIMLSAIALRQPFEFVGLQMAAGLTAIYSLRQLTQRSELFRAIVYVTMVSLLFRFCTDLLRISSLSDVMRPEYYYTYIYIMVNGVILLISYQLLFPVERLFQFTSSVTLVELSNLNNPLLRQLSEMAPGTFQHCMQVGNLAAEVANVIGAKSLLVRTGALYHDVGKLADPSFFTENQSGMKVKTEEFDYIKSAQRIIDHVAEGVELAKKNHLPENIIDFIRTHHGRSKAKYFYVSYKNAHPDEEVDESVFTYPGPNPSTKEQAILMMADAVEAASRSLSEYTEDSIGQLVDRIIDAQVSEGYFNECPLTFRDIAVSKETFRKRLLAINHTRIQYPELKQQ